jgi:DNA polymerase-1
VSETNKPDSVATIERPAEAETANGGDGRLLVIDGHSMAFRAFYALPADKFATDTGQHCWP